MRPGTTLSTVSCSGTRVQDKLEWQRLRLRLSDRRQVAVQIGDHPAKRRYGVADRCRIGRVRVNEHAWLLATVDHPVEVRRNLDYEQQLAALKSRVGLGLRS
jgi:hypothetical protein